MFRGLYTAVSGMLSQQRRIEMMTNNIANANTPGYKADQASLRAFPEMLMHRIQQTTIPTEKNSHGAIGRTLSAIDRGVRARTCAELCARRYTRNRKQH